MLLGHVADLLTPAPCPPPPTEETRRTWLLGSEVVVCLEMLSHRSSSQTAADLPSSPPTPQTRSCPQCRVLMTSNRHHQAETVRPRPGRPRVTLTKTPDGGLSPIPPSRDSRLTLDNLLCSQMTSRKSISTLISQKHSNATSETAGAGLALTLNRKQWRRAERQHERASLLKPGLDLRDLQEVWRMEDISYQCRDNCNRDEPGPGAVMAPHHWIT